MHFCVKCSNMYYHTVDVVNPNKLIYYCRNCGHKDENISLQDVVVSKIELKGGEQEFSHIINQYTKLDPTLPRVADVLCPNAECLTNKESDMKPEIIYIRYDDINMKYVHLCCTCDTIWKPATKS